MKNHHNTVEAKLPNRFSIISTFVWSFAFEKEKQNSVAESNGVEDDRHSRSRSFLDRRNRSVTKRGNEQHVRRIQSTRLAVIQDVRSSVTWAAGSSRFALINTALICSFDLPFHPSLAVFSMNLPSSRSPPIGRLFVEFGIASAALPSRFHAWERSLQRGPS